MSKDFFTVSELGAQVGAPRTTINDYLSRYSEYIESEIRGKRRVYSDRAVAVLMEINRMRGDGKSYAEIGPVLAGKYPLQAEVHENEPFKEDDMDVDDKVSSQAVVSVDEIHAIGQYLAKSEEQRRRDMGRVSRRMLWPLCILIVIVLGMGVGTALIGAKLLKSMKSDAAAAATATAAANAELSTRMAGVEQRLQSEVRGVTGKLSEDQKRSLDAMVFKLDERNQALQKELTTLRSEMVEQRKADAAKFKELHETMAGKMAGEIELLKKKHADEIAVTAAAAEKFKADLAAANAEIASRRAGYDKLSKENERLNSENSTLQDRIGQLDLELAMARQTAEAAQAAPAPASSSPTADVIAEAEAVMAESSAPAAAAAPAAESGK
ncbi:MAG: MerR family transcriptional regulator [Victivallaceae bacterium]|nr:MerR family transcriptional regulator [Victivallaceae bacterium]